MTVTVKAVRACVAAAQSRGVPPEAVLRPLGIDRALLEDPDAHVPLTCVRDAWATAVRLTGDAALGLHAAELVTARPLHVVDYMAASARSARDIFVLVERYQRLLGSRQGLRLEVHGDRATFARVVEIERAVRPPEMDDFVVAQWALRLRSRCGAFPLRAVRLDRAAPADTREYARIFQAPVAFDAGTNAIEFDAALLDVELRDADPALVAILRRHADEALAYATPTSRESRTSDLLRSRLVTGPIGAQPEIQAAARGLGLSERSLQRRLRAEGTSFKEVVESVRRELALSYLRDRRLSVSEVGFLLGFAEVSGFSRAFRRWTGKSPAAWRARAASSAAKSLARTRKTAAPRSR